MTAAERPQCGGCVFFDPNSVDGTPIGTIQVNGYRVVRGVCRAPMGLAISVGRTEVSFCGQPGGVFRRKAAV